MCQKSHGQEVGGWWIVSGVREELPQKTVERIEKKHQKFITRGTIYRKEGDHQAAAVLSPEQREKRRAQDEAAVAREIAKAQQLWEKGVENHRCAVRYFENRGVKVADLPGGRLPKAIRCTALKSGDKQPWVDDRNQWLETGPGCIIVARVVDASGVPIGAQRIFITEDGQKRNRSLDGREVDCKLSVGPLQVTEPEISGCAVRLGRGYGTEHTVVSCEGIETGLALQAAVTVDGVARAVVWCHVSAVGLAAVTLPAGDVAGGGSGAIRRWVGAGDHDRVDANRGHRPGEYALGVAARRVARLYPGIERAVVVPCAACTDLVGADGTIVGGVAGEIGVPA